MIVPELCEMLPIDSGVEKWCKAVNKRVETINARRNTFEDLCEAGFDVNKMAEKLMILYNRM